jgi:Polyketide cyclase / dehydrase and lipid transport
MRNEVGDMTPPFQSKQSVQIDAPLEAVWEFSMDLTKIPSFHPRVFKVDLISGKNRRGAGVAYRCHLVGGKHFCTEKDVELVPMEKFVTILPEDTFGISKLLPDYRVETTFRRVSERVTEVTISHYYSTPSLKARLFNLIGKRKIARETYATLNSAKAQIEQGVSGDRERGHVLPENS